MSVSAPPTIFRHTTRDEGLRADAGLRFGVLHPLDDPPPPSLPDLTVRQAHARLWERLSARERVECACCRRETNIRDQKLSVTMARFLVRLVRLHLETPGPRTISEVSTLPQVSKQRKKSTDAAYLVHWGVLARPTTDQYLALSDGVAYVLGRLHAVPLHVHLYGKRLLGVSQQMVTIHEVLDKPGRRDLASLVVWVRDNRPALLRPTSHFDP